MYLKSLFESYRITKEAPYGEISVVGLAINSLIKQTMLFYFVKIYETYSDNYFQWA